MLYTFFPFYPVVVRGNSDCGKNRLRRQVYIFISISAKTDMGLIQMCLFFSNGVDSCGHWTGEVMAKSKVIRFAPYHCMQFEENINHLYIYKYECMLLGITMYICVGMWMYVCMYMYVCVCLCM